MRTLFCGSSLTWAYSAWQQKFGENESSNQNDYVMSHGGFWLKSWLQAEEAFSTNGACIYLPMHFQIRTPFDEILDHRFHGNGTFKYAKKKNLTLKMSKYDQLVFTTPMLFWDLSFTYLFKRGHGLLTETSADLFREASLTNALSRAAFLELHKERFSHSYRFLAAVRKIAPNLKIFIAPAVLPTEKHRQYSPVWRRLHSLEKEVIYQEHERLFDCISMVQPPETLKEGLFSKQKYMSDDQHHYNADFVQLLSKRYGF